MGLVRRLNRDLDVCAACGVRDRGCIESAFGRQMLDDPGFEVSLWIADGAHPKQVAALAGHSSVSVVLDRYGHLYPAHDDDLILRLERRRR